MSPSSLVFDGLGRRLVVVDGELQVSAADPDGAEELYELLRQWLGYMDAHRGGVGVTETLSRLLELCVEHATDCGLYR
jgi:hypothetical protein